MCAASSIHMSHHDIHYVTSSYILCPCFHPPGATHTVSLSIIIYTMSHHHTYYVTSSYIHRPSSTHTVSLSFTTNRSIYHCLPHPTIHLSLCIIHYLYTFSVYLPLYIFHLSTSIHFPSMPIHPSIMCDVTGLYCRVNRSGL